MNSFAGFRQTGGRGTSSPPWTRPNARSTGTRPRPLLGFPTPVIVGVAASVIVAAGLVVALISLVATSSPHPAVTSRAAAMLVALRTSTASPGSAYLVQLGDEKVALDNSSVGINVTGPGGPQIDPNVAAGVEPGAAVDGFVVPLAKALTAGSGQLGLHTPTIASIKAIGVNVGIEGRITATVHPYEGILSTGQP